MNNKKWNVLPSAPSEQLASLIAATEGSLLLAQLLYNRGISDLAAAKLFLLADRGLSHDPFLMDDMESAVERVLRALVAGELIAVHGDYDADGLTATALLSSVVTSLGGRARPHIPNRAEEGYGLNRTALRALAAEGVSLVITADCGTNAVEEVDYARSLGLDVIVTDHHTVDSQLPAATAVLNPKRLNSTYPFRDLAGVGVAFKLAQGLLRRIDMQPTIEEDDLLDLVALGTVADLVPLVGENRYFVKRGLEVINTTPRVGLRSLIWRAGIQPGKVDSSTIAYALGPRLNAAGRVDDAYQGYRLLATADEHEAGQLAELLEGKNAERQRMTDHAFTTALDGLLPVSDRASILISVSRDYAPGIVGLVAGKLADQFYRPAVVIQEGEADCRGSARSIPEFNIVEALGSCRDYLTKFGGHAQAAGFSLRRADLPHLEGRLAALADAALTGMELKPFLAVDAQVDLSDLNGHTISILRRLAPFGMGNPIPIFLSKGVRVLEGRRVGKQGDHLRLRLSDGSASWSAIGFGLGGLAADLPRVLDAVFAVDENEWNGERFIQLRVRDLRNTIGLRSTIG